jgi:hypothetical protein
MLAFTEHTHSIDNAVGQKRKKNCVSFCVFINGLQIMAKDISEPSEPTNKKQKYKIIFKGKNFYCARLLRHCSLFKYSR